MEDRRRISAVLTQEEIRMLLGRMDTDVPGSGQDSQKKQPDKESPRKDCKNNGTDTFPIGNENT